ncbi:MAG TPA: hypothetical protein VJ804_09445 [Acidimicrobiales bacterium]|nr:hypothetical protein [Acidimicrobiales bacterium]
MQTIQHKVKWSCAPGWPYDLTPITVYTNETAGLTGGHFLDDDKYGVLPPRVPCNAAYRAPIPARATTRRLEGASATHSYTVGGWGFSGGQTTSYRTYAEVSWTNDSQLYQRYLCGESSYITGRTRVSAGG